MNIPFTQLVCRLPDVVPFVGPETLERSIGVPFKARLGANESAFGISPLARDAIKQAVGIEGCSWYGDPENFELRELLAAKHDVSMDNICVDAGIDSLLGLTIRLFVEPGSSVVTSSGAYPTVNYHINGFSGVIHTVPYKDHHEDTVALADAAQQTTARLVYLANPDNPMGTCLSAASIQSLIDRLPDDCVLMLDEAYSEFMTSHDMLQLDVSKINLIRYRTFSKAYGLAGMRIGYALAHEQIIAGFNKVRNHFGVNRLAQIAAAASLRDLDFLPCVIQEVEQGRQRIYDLASSLNLSFLPSATNFVTVNLDDAERAARLINVLGEAGVFMRKPMVAPQNTFIRIGVGSEAEHKFLLSVIKPALQRV